MLNVRIQVGRLKVLLRIAGHANTKVRRQSLLHGGVQILTTVQVANHRHQLRAVTEAVGLRDKVALSRQGVATQGHHILNTQEVEVQQFALNARLRGAATDHVRHHLQVRIATDDGAHDGRRTGALGHRHLLKRAISIRHILHLVAMAGHVDERRLKLHQRFNAVVQPTHVAALERRHKFKTGERSLRTIDDVDDFHIVVIFFIVFVTLQYISRAAAHPRPG